MILIIQLINIFYEYEMMMNGKQYEGAMIHVESNIPIPNNKFLREKCNAKTDVFFVAKVRNR